MFINISNHPSSRWSDDQLGAAHRLDGEGEEFVITDIPFPSIPADAGGDEIEQIAYNVFHAVIDMTAPTGAVVMVQGEFTFTLALVRLLQGAGYTCVAACSERQAVENADGTKTVAFNFVRFREYAD